MHTQLQSGHGDVCTSWDFAAVSVWCVCGGSRPAPGSGAPVRTCRFKVHADAPVCRGTTYIRRGGVGHAGHQLPCRPRFVSQTPCIIVAFFVVQQSCRTSAPVSCSCFIPITKSSASNGPSTSSPALSRAPPLTTRSLAPPALLSTLGTHLSCTQN